MDTEESQAPKLGTSQLTEQEKREKYRKIELRLSQERYQQPEIWRSIRRAVSVTPCEAAVIGVCESHDASERKRILEEEVQGGDPERRKMVCALIYTIKVAVGMSSRNDQSRKII